MTDIGRVLRRERHFFASTVTVLRIQRLLSVNRGNEEKRKYKAEAKTACA